MTFVPRTLEDLAHEFPPQITHLSASGISTAMRCLEQWRQSYLLGNKNPPALRQLAGRADHSAIEASMKKKIETYEDLPVNVVREWFVNDFEEQVDEVGGLSGIQNADRKEYDRLRYSGQDLVEAYQRSVSPTIQPVACEEWFEVSVEGLPVQLVGRIDLEDLDRVIDRKRTQRADSKPRPEWVMQGRIYQLVKPKTFEWHLSVDVKHFHVKTDLRQEAVSPDATKNLIAKVATMIGAAYQQFGPDEEWPTTGATHDWACNWCGYKPECSYWKGTA